jgi:hypothetical protein
MSRTATALLIGLALCVTLVGCSKEIKPSKTGAYIVQGEKLTELPLFVVDEELSGEGFTSYFFIDEPKVKVAPGDFYFILYGDMTPQGIRRFAQKGGHYELDNSKPLPSDAFNVALMKDETKMYKCRVSKELAVGTYVIDMKRPNGVVSVAFTLGY